MAFLDNSGDIILDAVLTDTGRKRLARGDGSFNVAKFALGDDEINYELYDKNHASGSAYYDINILQTPVLEAFTNNTSTMKNKLITISRTNLLYLPVIKMVTISTITSLLAKPAMNNTGIHVVAVNQETVDKLGTSEKFINGHDPSLSAHAIYFDQGLDTSNKPSTQGIDPDLQESQFIVHIDHRLGSLSSHSGGGLANYSFLDDDNVATYYFATAGTTGNNAGFATTLGTRSSTSAVETHSQLLGATGARLGFTIKASDNLENSQFLFDQIGLDGTTTIDGKHYFAIDTVIKVMGGTTGYSVEVPVRFVKYSHG
tara:strand:+ start:120 stop:1064 length:945 start_codon:yes stop_codon:yes gene_type:complete